jgi:hypothetical protein
LRAIGGREPDGGARVFFCFAHGQAHIRDPLAIER